MEIEGIGDVTLDVETHPTHQGSQHQGKIILHDVLYAPKAAMNILGAPIIDSYEVMIGFPLGKITDPQSGACVGLLDLVKLFRLRLRGQRSDQTSLDPNSHYAVRANWSDSERKRWKTPKGCPPLTDKEKAWLKEH